MHQSILAAGLLAVTAAPVAANPYAGLLRFTAQVRAQSTLVEAQTAVIFDNLPRGRILADDIYDELEDLCRDLDRLETDLTRRHASRGLARRLERRAQRLDEQACELREAVEEAILDANRRSRHGVGRRFPVTHHPTQFAVAPGVTRGVSVSVGSGRFRLAFGAPQAPVYTTHQRFVGRNAAFALPVGVAGPGGCVPPAAAEALRVEADRLRLMTKQLVAILCD